MRINLLRGNDCIVLILFFLYIENLNETRNGCIQFDADLYMEEACKTRLAKLENKVHASHQISIKPYKGTTLATAFGLLQRP